MKFVLFVPQKDFKDETVSLVKLIFNKWGIQCDIASYGRSNTGMHGAVYKTEVPAANIITKDYDGIILADGKGIDDQKIYEYRPLLDILIRFNDSNKPIIAVGNATKIPARANLVRDKKIVVSDEDTKRLTMLFYGIPSNNDFEISGNIITLRNSRALENSAETLLQHMGVS
jgi:putative intracellular protease/amidase